MIVAAGDRLPFVDGPATPLRDHGVFGGQVVGQQAMSVGVVAEERQCPRIAQRGSQAGADE